MKSPEKSIDLTHKTIVVMYMLYFGDMISITPFLEILRRAADHSKIILVIDSRFQDALRYNPDIDEIVPFDRHGSQKSLGATWKAGRKLAEQNPDILITLHGTARTSVMAWAMHPRFWAGEAGTEIDRFLMDLPMTIETYDCHAVDKYIHVLQRMGVQDLKHSGMKTYTCPGWEKEADEFFTASGIQPGERLAGFSAGSSTPEKNWPAEKFGQTADFFAGRGYRPVFFGIESEKGLVSRAVSAMSRKGAVSAAGKLSMGGFIAAAGRCSLFFTNDSGPMYVADSRGVPTIAMFGPSNAKFHHPLGPFSTALSSWDMPECPEHVNQNIKTGRYVPIENISVDDVIGAGLAAEKKAGIIHSGGASGTKSRSEK